MGFLISIIWLFRLFVRIFIESICDWNIKWAIKCLIAKKPLVIGYYYFGLFRYHKHFLSCEIIRNRNFSEEKFCFLYIKLWHLENSSYYIIFQGLRTLIILNLHRNFPHLANYNEKNRLRLILIERRSLLNYMHVLKHNVLLKEEKRRWYTS